MSDRTTTLALAVTLACAMLVACGQSDNANNPTASNNDTPDAQTMDAPDTNTPPDADPPDTTDPPQDVEEDSPDADPPPDAEEDTGEDSPLDAGDDADDDAGDDDCVTDEAFFASQVAPVLDTTCVGCHVAQGPAGETRHVLVPFDGPEATAQNHQRVIDLINDHPDMADLYLQKPTNQVSHGGGQLFGIDSEQYNTLRQFVARTQAPGGCQDPSPPQPECGETIEPGPTPLRRLTDSQYRNALADLFGIQMPDALLPETSINEHFRTYTRNNPVSGSGVESIMLAAEAAASLIDIDAVRQCDQEETARQCTERTVLTLGYRAYRRPLSEPEATILLRPLDAGLPLDDALRMSIELMLQSPQFLYMDTASISDIPMAEIARMDDFAIASRLSFFLIDSTPDTELLQLAAAGELHTRQQVARQAQRLIQDPRARRAVINFHRDWINVWRLNNTVRDPSRYPDFDERTVASMLTELDLYVSEVVWDGDARFETLLFSDSTWIDSRLAAIYDLPDPGEGWHRVQLDERRPGILTRSAFLAAHSYAASSSPVQRGAFVLHDMFCEDLSPPADVNMDLPEPSEEARTVRERLEQHWTSGACRSCHTRIDPLGFAFEHFGAVGEWRTQWENGLEVDAVGSLEDPAGSFDGAAQMLELLDTSPRIGRCYARRWYEYAIGRPSEELIDRCAVDQLAERFEQTDGDIRNLMVDVVLTDAFLYRHNPTEVP